MNESNRMMNISSNKYSERALELGYTCLNDNGMVELLFPLLINPDTCCPVHLILNREETVNTLLPNNDYEDELIEVKTKEKNAGNKDKQITHEKKY